MLPVVGLAAIFVVLMTARVRYGDRMPSLNGVVYVVAPPPIPARCFQQVGFPGRPPRTIVAPTPVYPEAARRAGISGTVIVAATIDEHGRVIRTDVQRSVSGLDAAAVAALEHARFEPAALNGAPACVTIAIAVTFE
jgi:TonB family protein